MSDINNIDYSAIDGLAGENCIVVGLAWKTTLVLTSDEPWIEADENIDNWLFKLDPERKGGKARIELKPVSATIDPADDKIILIKLALTAAQTTGIIPSLAATWQVSARHRSGAEWYPFKPLRGKVSITNDSGDGS